MAWAVPRTISSEGLRSVFSGGFPGIVFFHLQQSFAGSLLRPSKRFLINLTSSSCFDRLPEHMWAHAGPLLTPVADA